MGGCHKRIQKAEGMGNFWGPTGLYVAVNEKMGCIYKIFKV